jgi:uncharacterized protein
VFYLDSSAWVKRYVRERGSLWVTSLFDRQEQIASVSLGYVETMAALSRRLPTDDLGLVEPLVKADWQNMIRLPFTGQLVEQAVDLARRYRLRGADAVHLTAASQLRGVLTSVGESVVLVSSDDELLKAALAHGLQVENPAAWG